MLYSGPDKVNETTAKGRFGVTRPRVCVLFPGALGDFICLLPALRYLARHSELDVYARSEYADLVDKVTVRSIERREIARLFVEDGASEAPVREFFAAYETVYSWAGSGQPVFREQLSRVAEARVFPFQPTEGSQHQADYYYGCVAAGTAAPLAAIPQLPSALSWWRGCAAQNDLIGNPLLVLAPGSGALEKNWPAHSFLQVADWWRQEKHGRVLTLLGPVEAERRFQNDWANTSVIRSPTLAQAAALLAHCQLFLGNDSGMTHLAAAAGAPTVAVFGPSDPTQWAPRGKAVYVLSRRVECSPCTVALMKSCTHRKCLLMLPPAQAIAQIERLTTEYPNLTR